ncbi:hypothetical protein A9R00_03820 [Oleispira antarctica]|uniref:YecA family protein n=1 Tax=Oleispira antarctica TaxID=188908 RepID=A0A1Y5HY74_OLEAN|nr:hypothetical protein A9R00_03820 [Oleispira antarctica]
MSDLLSIPALDEDELELLGQMLEDEMERQESFDFFEAHGLITALKTGPAPLEWPQIYDMIFPEKTAFNDEQLEQVKRLLRKLSYEIQAWLDSGQDFPVPCDLTLQVEDDDEEGAAIEGWAAGFMAGILQNEAAWYGDDEEKMAEWIFPIMYVSGLFAEEAEMAEIDEDETLSNQMCVNIPPAIVEMFLHFHATKG